MLARRPLPTSPPSGEEIRLLADIAQAMRDASICGLGQTAASAIQSAIPLMGLH
jgi:NADH-quinone oxidoreductase subunit F